MTLHHVFGRITLTVLHTHIMQGRPSLLVDFRLVDRAGRVQPHDGRAQGELQVRGLHVAREYFRVRGVLFLIGFPEPIGLELPQSFFMVDCMGGMSWGASLQHAARTPPLRMHNEFFLKVHPIPGKTRNFLGSNLTGLCPACSMTAATT